MLNEVVPDALRCDRPKQDFPEMIFDGGCRTEGIVHREATGVDESLATAAKGLGLTAEPLPAEWDRCRRSAGTGRDEAMVAAGTELCFALHQFIPGRWADAGR